MLALPFAVLSLVQTIWIVDAANGPGTNFTDLPPAVAAAASGDTILVRSGTYAAFNVSGKALTIRGAAPGTGPTATIIGMPAPAGSPSLQVRIANVPPGAQFRLAGLTIKAPHMTNWQSPPNPMLQIAGAGTVVVLTDLVVEGVWMPNDNVTNKGTTAVEVSNGATVHAARCSVTGGEGYGGGDGAFVATGCRFAADACTFTGRDGTSASSLLFPPPRGGIGLLVDYAAVTLARSSIYAGYGYFPGYAALYLSGVSSARIAGTSADTIMAAFGYTQLGANILAFTTSSVIVHGNVTIGPPYPQFGPFGPVQLGAPPLPYLSITGSLTPAGEITATQPVTATFDGVIPGAPFACLVDAVPTFSSQFAPLALGELLVPLSATIPLAGTLDALGMFQVTLTPGVSLAGTAVHSQFGVLDAGAGQVRMSNELIRFFN